MKKLKKNNFTTFLVKMFKTESNFCLILGYSGSTTLTSYLEKKPFLKVKKFRFFNSKPRKLRELFVKVCRCLQFCHSKGIVHKDIKLDNLMIRTNEEINLVDFGFAEMISKTSTLHSCGTPYYIPPEFIKNSKTQGSFPISWFANFKALSPMFGLWGFCTLKCWLESFLLKTIKIILKKSFIKLWKKRSFFPKKWDWRINRSFRRCLGKTLKHEFNFLKS